METRNEVPVPASGGEPKLVFRTGPSRGKVLVIDKDRLTVGRGAESDIMIRDDIVSTLHIILGKASDGTYWIKDEGSKNGTYLNGRRLEGIAPLSDQDVFCLAQTGPEIQFTYGEPELPSLLGASTATFVRTKSILALKELFPQSSSKGVVSKSGVHELENSKLEEVARKSRRNTLSYIMASAGLALLSVLVFFQVKDRFSGDPGSGGRTPVSSSSVVARPPAPEVRSKVELDLKLEPIYGCLFHSYRNNAIGRVHVTNQGDTPLSGTRLQFELFFKPTRDKESFLVEDFVLDVPDVEPGKEWSSDIKPLLSTQILASRNREVTASVTLVKDKQEVDGITRAALIYGYHVFNWENPNRIAVFIDAEDPVVDAFANAAVAVRPKTSQGEFPPRTIVSAVTILTAVAGRKLHYRDDAHTPSRFGAQSKVNDRIKYPDETLKEGSGDCDDLSVLCCSLLKAVGVPTVFVVGADHVLFMFDSGFGEERLEDSPFDSETIVPWKGRLWIPVESTNLAEANSSFMTAWAAAWKRRQSILDGEMKVVDIQEAWQTYIPLRKPSDDDDLEKARIQGSGWVDARVIGEKAEEAVASLKKLYLENLSSKVDNLIEEYDGLARQQAIGLFYARSGLYSRAREVFEKAIFGDAVPETVEAIERFRGEITDEIIVLLCNLAVAQSMSARTQEELSRAAGYYKLSLRGIPDGYPEKGEVILRLALIHHMNGELLAAKKWTTLAYRIDPGLEETYKALIAGDGTVAGESGQIFEYLKKGLRSFSAP